jgi:nitric oxide reductase NorD protein
VLAEQRRKDAEERPSPTSPTFEAFKHDAPELPDGFRVELRLQGEPIPPAHDVQELLDSIVQDLGQIPQDYLVAAGHGTYSAGPPGDAAADEATPAERAELYDEWDYKRQQYRKQWCQLSERDVHPQHDHFVAQTREKYRGLLKHLYRTFEALRGEEKMLKRQPHGDDIDIDAVVEAFADETAGLESSGALFTKRRRLDRDVAVMFLVDMSGSTKGWINDIERESLVLLCESLEILGDRYAIFGFSGFTHKRCELFRIKSLEEDYNDEVRARISGIKPQDYTRMGVAIRHLTRLFQSVEAKTRLLIALTDGRPDDQDGYRGSYGIEDTRQALFEARYQGIHPYCITIDDEALEYLPHMYGAANFSVISDVSKLPLRVSDIYRRITV